MPRQGRAVRASRSNTVSRECCTASALIPRSPAPPRCCVPGTSAPCPGSAALPPLQLLRARLRAQHTQGVPAGQAAMAHVRAALPTSTSVICVSVQEHTRRERARSAAPEPPCPGCAPRCLQPPPQGAAGRQPLGWDRGVRSGTPALGAPESTETSPAGRRASPGRLELWGLINQQVLMSRCQSASPEPCAGHTGAGWARAGSITPHRYRDARPSAPGPRRAPPVLGEGPGQQSFASQQAAVSAARWACLGGSPCPSQSSSFTPPGMLFQVLIIFNYLHIINSCMCHRPGLAFAALPGRSV